MSNLILIKLNSENLLTPFKIQANNKAKYSNFY
jgi:hypothetical protein